ncbi:hypothetical protein H0H92_000471 [Tricholoma furcatifolium]|nr:hypothetical protein H0H92_000471 [Tricholoma furcatifolium]
MPKHTSALEQSDTRGTSDPYPTEYSAGLKRAPEASPAKSRGEQRRPKKISRLNLSEEATPNSEEDSPIDYDPSPTSSPTGAHSQVEGLPLPEPNDTYARPPTSKGQIQATSLDSPQPAPPYTQAETIHPYPQPSLTTQNTLTRNDNPTDPGEHNSTDHQAQGTTHTPDTSQAIDTQATPRERLPKDLHFHKTPVAHQQPGPQEHNAPTVQTAQSSAANQASAAPAQTEIPQQNPSTNNESQDAMTVDTEGQGNENPDKPRGGPQPPPPPKPTVVDPAFAPTPRDGFPYTQLGTHPTFLLSEEVQSACDAKPFPKIWARLWRGGYDEEKQKDDILSLQKLIFLRTGQRPHIIAPIRDEKAKKGRNHDRRYNPPYHYLIYGIPKEACETLTSARALSTKDTQAFFIPYDPPPPNFLCTIRGFHFNILADESSPEQNLDIDDTVLKIIQRELRRDQEFEHLVRIRCTSGDSPETFITALAIERHLADVPRERGDDPNAPPKKELRWNLGFRAPPPLKRDGYYTLALYFAQKKYIDIEWGRAQPLADDAKYHCVNCKAANHVSKECSYLIIPGWHGAPAGEDAPESLEHADQAPHIQNRGPPRRGGGGGGFRGYYDGGRRGQGKRYR